MNLTNVKNKIQVLGSTIPSAALKQIIHAISHFHIVKYGQIPQRSTSEVNESMGDCYKWIVNDGLTCLINESNVSNG